MKLAHRTPSRAMFAVAAITGLAALAGCTAAGGVEDAGSAPAPVVETVEQNTVSIPRLSAASALAAAEAALAQCEADGLGFVTVAVVDRFGQPQALLRGNGAAAHTLDAAQQKAYTSAAFGANTSELTERATGEGPTVADLPGTLFLPGGVPVKLGDATVAGIGVGGAPSGAADEVCATAGAEILTEELAG